jgi:hypothetical protein
MRQTRKERAAILGGRLGDPPLPRFYGVEALSMEPLGKLWTNIDESLHRPRRLARRGIRSILGRDGLRAVPFFSLFLGPEIISRTAQRPSLPRKTNKRQKLPLSAGSSEICPYRAGTHRANLLVYK